MLMELYLKSEYALKYYNCMYLAKKPNKKRVFEESDTSESEHLPSHKKVCMYKT